MSDDARQCAALLVSAPASGQGKTTVTAALAALWRAQGLRVRVFKTGPDFLDPMVHEAASGAPCYQLDLWMGDEAHVRSLLWHAAGCADVILVEGVMGLHDGQASSAQLARRLGLPVLLVIDASAMAQTFGALAWGLAHDPAGLAPPLPLAGVLANRVASARHAQLLRDSLPAGLSWYGALAADAALDLPHRHLGLVAAPELPDLPARLARLAAAAQTLTPPRPPSVRFERPCPRPPEQAAVELCGGGDTEQPLAGVQIAIARDAAFCFVYPANLDVLRVQGAQLRFFSPLANEPVPADSDAVYLPGGYPELHLAALSAAHATAHSLHAHHAQGRPLVAECGGLLALADGLTDLGGHRAALWGLLPGECQMQARRVNLGLHSVALPEGHLRGHSFHHGRLDTPLPPHSLTLPQRAHGQPEAVYRLGPQGRLHASFLHLYFPSNPAAAARLFQATAR